MNPERFDAFRASYAPFLQADAERPDASPPILLTGHSHQAWPLAAREGMLAYFDDTARYVDDKWGRVAAVADEVRRKILVRLGFPESDALAFGKSTHELVYRLLTCLPRGARVVVTTGEFHSLDRQLRRLAEEGLSVEWVDAHPRASLAERLAAATTADTALVALSAVLFEDAYVVRDIERVLERARQVGAVALVDAYHAFNVVPLSETEQLGPAWDDAFVTAGGYKYGQMGEGVCFLRLPPSAEAMRPVYTGWFADFASLEKPRGKRSVDRVDYASGGDRFAGATFDPVSLYRARAVLEHFDRFELDARTLRAISVRQTSLLVDRLCAAGASIVSPEDAHHRGGFVAVRCADAHAVVRSLRSQGVFVDARGDALRAGPAPYLLDDELERGAAAIAAAVRTSR